MAFIQRCINVDAASWRCIDVDATLPQRCVLAGDSQDSMTRNYITEQNANNNRTN